MKGCAVYAIPDYGKRIETTKIAPKELKTLMKTKSGTYIIVDVRDPHEFAEGHIPGAINIPANII